MQRIYVPVPKLLEPAFRITDGAKEFYVQFDTIVSESVFGFFAADGERRTLQLRQQKPSMTLR